MNSKQPPTRRQILEATFVFGASLVLGGCTRSPSGGPHPETSQRPNLTGTIASGDTSSSPYRETSVGAPDRICRATADNIEGPFYKPDAPIRTTLNRLVKGHPLMVRGVVQDAQCRPIAGARLDVWQANADGEYDNAGFELRGQVVTLEDGQYSFDTIHPGHYLNGRQYRPAHIHVKVSAPGKRPLTTQLYFPGDPYNEGDPFIDRSLIMRLHKRSSGPDVARFDFGLV